jgi:hypothetical protein
MVITRTWYSRIVYLLVFLTVPLPTYARSEVLRASATKFYVRYDTGPTGDPDELVQELLSAWAGTPEFEYFRENAMRRVLSFGNASAATVHTQGAAWHPAEFFTCNSLDAAATLLHRHPHADHRGASSTAVMADGATRGDVDSDVEFEGEFASEAAPHQPR